MAASVDAVMREELRSLVADPPTVVHIPKVLREAFHARKQHEVQRVLRIGGLCGMALGLTIVAARMLLFSGLGTHADNVLYGQISVFNLVVIFTTIVALQLPRVFAHYRPIMVTAGALVLASTHTGSILIREPHIALSASYAAMLGVTVVTIGFRNGFGYSLLTCMLGFVGGSRYAVWQGARPDWVLVSYGYVAASAVGLVISWLVERQDALHFFQSILLASEAEERLRLNQQLEAMSRTDSLSGLANRRSFDDTLEAEWARMRRERAPLSLVFVDVDHFKRFNDANGHRAGDACLRAVGQALLSGALRPGDMAARYGGEEFVLLLPKTDLAGGEAVAHRVLAAIDELCLPHGDSPTASHVTISVGVAAAAPDSELEARHLVETADACLYRAKNQGRHCVCVSELRGDSLRPLTRQQNITLTGEAS